MVSTRKAGANCNISVISEGAIVTVITKQTLN